MKNIPNILTMLRMLLIPVLVFILYFDDSYVNIVATAIFLIASFTDFFDGYLARMWKVQSKFGRLFDPIADKLIISTTAIMLIYKGKIIDINVIAVIVIIAREILVSGFREFASSSKKTMAVSGFGKLKTVLQIMALTGLILIPKSSAFLYFISILLLWLATIVSVFSAYKYSKVITKIMS